MFSTPFYDPEKTFEENFEQGPFGEMANGLAFANAGEPKYDFLGQKVFLPFGIPAGTLLNSRFLKAALNKGFDLVTCKTVRSKSHPCNPWPNVRQVDTELLRLSQAEEGVKLKAGFREPMTITNSFGVPSKDPDFWQKDLSEAVNFAAPGQVVIGSFQGTVGADAGGYVQDFATCARLVKETGVKILEVNLSCPNEGTGNLLCFDIVRVQEVVEAIKNEIGNTPLIIKLAYFKEHKLLEELVGAVGEMVQGIEAINTIMSKIVDEKGGPGFKDGRKFSGVGGAGIKWAGLDMVSRLKDLREKGFYKFVIIGVGGVMSVEDYQEYMRTGADAVMSSTGSMWDPFLAQEIKRASGHN